MSDLTHKPADNLHGWVGSIVTVTGDEFDIANPKPEQVDVAVIAHALSMQCRYNGHVPTFYSVAEHSVRVAQWLEDHGQPVQVCLTGLFHDAAEAYVGDMVRPMKRMPVLGEEFLRIEANVAAAISLAVDLPLADGDMPEIVHDADKALFEWETVHIRSGRLTGWRWRYARDQFIAEFDRLVPLR